MNEFNSSERIVRFRTAVSMLNIIHIVYKTLLQPNTEALLYTLLYIIINNGFIGHFRGTVRAVTSIPA